MIPKQLQNLCLAEIHRENKRNRPWLTLIPACVNEKIGFLSNVIRIQSTKCVIDKLTPCGFASEPVGGGGDYFPEPEASASLNNGDCGGGEVLRPLLEQRIISCVQHEDKSSAPEV